MTISGLRRLVYLCHPEGDVMAEGADSMPASARSYRTIKAIEALQVRKIQHPRRGGWAADVRNTGCFACRSATQVLRRTHMAEMRQEHPSYFAACDLVLLLLAWVGTYLSLKEKMGGFVSLFQACWGTRAMMYPRCPAFCGFPPWWQLRPQDFFGRSHLKIAVFSTQAFDRHALDEANKQFNHQLTIARI
jgi:hypothetical protein